MQILCLRLMQQARKRGEEMKKSNQKNICAKVKVDTSEVKSAVKKAKRLRRLLIEANSLADELASKNLDFSIYMKY